MTKAVIMITVIKVVIVMTVIVMIMFAQKWNQKSSNCKLLEFFFLKKSSDICQNFQLKLKRGRGEGIKSITLLTLRYSNISLCVKNCAFSPLPRVFSSEIKNTFFEKCKILEHTFRYIYKYIEIAELSNYLVRLHFGSLTSIMN